MPGLVPGIHAFFFAGPNVDGRDEPGHDECDAWNAAYWFTQAPVYAPIWPGPTPCAMPECWQATARS